jgi:hypothetical protein
LHHNDLQCSSREQGETADAENFNAASEECAAAAANPAPMLDIRGVEFHHSGR